MPLADPPVLDGVTSRFVDVRGARLHVAEAGDGDPVVLLHGWPQHWWMWRKVIPLLAPSYRLICPDLRGFGWSQATPSGYEKEDLALDVIGLLDALGLERVRLVGHDWGGLVGFLACLRHPERVVRYLALNTGHPFVRVDARMAGALWRFWYQAVLAAPVLGPAVVAGGGQRFVRFLHRWLGDPQSWSPEDTEVFLARLREPERARATQAMYRTFLLRELPRGVLGRYRSLRLTTPTLFVHGTADAAIPPVLLRGFERHADDFTLELVDGVGHWIAEERPDLVARRAATFFAS